MRGDEITNNNFHSNCIFVDRSIVDNSSLLPRELIFVEHKSYSHKDSFFFIKVIIFCFVKVGQN